MTTLAVTRTHGHSLREVHFGAGAVAGIIAALLMGAGIMLVTLIQDRGIFLVPQLIATLVMSSTAADSAVGIIVGLGIHLGLGAVFGLIFAYLYTLVTARYEARDAILLGLVYGLTLWAVNFLLIGPAIGAQLTEHIEPMIAIPTHLLFGFGLAIYPYLVERDES